MHLAVSETWQWALPCRLCIMRLDVAVVVSTIAVKRSNRSAALLVEVWRKTNKQTPLTSTSGRGRFGRGSVHLILSFPALSAQSSADGVIPENRCHFSGIRKDRTEVPVPGTIPRTVIPVCGTGSLVLGKKTLVSSRYLPQPSYTCVSKWRSKGGQKEEKRRTKGG